MKKLGVVLQYELMTYIKNKSYVISTVVIAVIAAAIMFVPRFIDISAITGITNSTEQNSGDSDSDKDNKADNNKDVILIYDESGTFSDIQIIQAAFDDMKVEKVSSESELKDKVSDEEVKAGFVVHSLTDYEYIVYNKSMTDSIDMQFNQVLTALNQMVYCSIHNLDYEQIITAFNPEINSQTVVLGKDMGNNYFYCYALIIIIFMIIIFYGVMVATSVTQEKSNRTIEVLVTSADTKILFFGKVLAGTIASLCQAGILMLAIVGAYKFNQSAWGGMLDMLLDIPANVLVTYALFGLGGVLFYTFIYGAFGALVSKTEDINKSAGSIQMVIMIVYFITLFQLMNIDGIAMKVLSYLPISSYSAMFARVAMGNVAVFDTETRIPAEKISFALNQRLPNDIRIQKSDEVPLDWHPRYRDSTKTYEYKILNRRFPDPLQRFYTHFMYMPLDEQKMKEAAEYIVGEHDFASFCSAGSQVDSTVRTVYSLSVNKRDDVISIRITGNGFLYNMVRIIVGTLIKVGLGVYPPEHVKEIIEAKDRYVAGPKAPACGLTLVGIEYSE